MDFNNLKITGLTMRNFLSVGNATQAIRFDEHGMTLVLGNNNDATNGSTRNGAGKSAVLQALSFALYGKPLTKIKIPNLVNNINLKGMHVSVDFEKGGKKYRIERGRNPTIMKFYVNGEDVTGEDDKEKNDAKGENAETQVDINRIIGMSHTMFKHIVALNTYTEPFLKESDAKQREIIEELLGITQMSAKAEKLKAKMVLTKDRVKFLEAQVSATQAANKRIELSIDNARRDASVWEKKQENEIADLKEQLLLTNSIDFEAELKLFDDIDNYNSEYQRISNELSLVNEQINSLRRSQTDIMTAISRSEGFDEKSFEQTIQRLEKEIERTEKRIVEYNVEKTKTSEAIDHFEHMLAHPDDQDCRTCNQKLKGTDHLKYVVGRFEEELAVNKTKLKEIETNITDAEEHLVELRADITTQNDNKKIQIEKFKSEETARLEEKQRIDVEMNKLVNTQNDIQEKLVLLNGRPETIFTNRQQLYDLKYQKDIIVAEITRLEGEDNPHIKQINGFRTAIQKIDMEPINQETDLYRHQEFLYKLLTNKDSFIRRTIIEENLSFLNERLGYYLTKMGLPHDVVFQSDLRVEITLLGRDFDFAQLSRGESNRVIMATSWAFRDVWESLNNSINIMWVDELIDSGLCASGAEDALQILKTFSRNGRNIFLISHREELMGRIDRTIYIAKQNGFTHIQEEDIAA
jgi:DNA repair exonuclease SbcCD ATPase subunit